MAASGTAFLLSGPQLAADRLVDCDLSSFTASHFYVQHRTQQAGDGRRKARRKQRVPFASILISKSFDLLDARPPMDELTSGAFPDFLVGQVLVSILYIVFNKYVFIDMFGIYKARRSLLLLQVFTIGDIVC